MSRDSICRWGMGLGIIGLATTLWTNNPWWLLLYVAGGLAWTYWAKTER